MNDNNSIKELQKQCIHCELINDKSTFIKHEKQNTYWVVCNSEITYHECICSEDSSKWRYKSDDNKSADKKLHTELVTTKEN